jgi:PAS domain S-box-containing protein/diguanylate cyclase (GGDEF)-like protein
VDLRDAAAPLAAMGHAVVALDTGGRITFWNAKAAGLSGWAPETAMGRPFYDLLVGRSRLELIEGLDLLAAGRRWQADLDLEGPRGRALRVEVSAEPVVSGGVPNGSVAVLRSLSPSETARRLHDLAAVLRTVPDAVVVVDDEARVREWNPAAEAMFGWSRPQMLGVHVTRMVPPEDHRHSEEIWSRLVAGEELAPFETRRLDRDGRSRLVSVHTAGYRERGAFTGAVVTYRELSARQHDDRLLSDLVAQVPVAVAAYDETGRVTMAAGGGYLRAGVAPALARGTSLLMALPDGSRLHRAVSASLRGDTTDLQLLFDDRVWQCHVAPHAPGGFLAAVDVTSERFVDDRLQALLAAAPLAFVTFDASGRVTYAAGSAFREFGVDAADLVGLTVLDVYGDSAQINEAVVRCLAGHRVDLVTTYRDRVWDLHYRSYRDRTGAVTGGLVIAQDATAWLQPHDGTTAPRVAAVEQVHGLLERDELTGLPGRRGLQRRLEEKVPEGLTRAVAVVDLDAFSWLRDAHGSATADLVVQVVAGRLLTQGRPAMVGRWAGGSFVLVLDGPDAREELRTRLDAVTGAVSAPVTLPETVLHLTCSAGVAVSDQVPSGELLRAARLALGEARVHGGAQVRWFTADSRPVLRDVSLVRELREAIAGTQLRLHYQPVVAVGTGEARGVEALVRWEHPSQGLLLPGSFVPLAERSGLIHDLGHWVATRACHEALALAEGGTPLRVAVNVSARQLEQGLVDMLLAVLEETGCPATALSVEVTETALTADLDVAAATLAELKRLGFTVALDDFGTGYSSLLYLRRFPVDMLKIDRSFVAGLGVNAEDTAIVASTISLGHSIGLECVAEGVETLEQLGLLSRMGCDLAQGYLFSRALPPEQLTSWLSEHADKRGGGERPPHPSSASAAPPQRDEILRLHAEGASLNTIAAALNLAGNRTARGTRWRAQTVAAVVARWAYPALALGEDDAPA